MVSCDDFLRKNLVRLAVSVQKAHTRNDKPQNEIGRLFMRAPGRPTHNESCQNPEHGRQRINGRHSDVGQRRSRDVGRRSLCVCVCWPSDNKPIMFIPTNQPTQPIRPHEPLLHKSHYKSINNKKRHLSFFYRLLKSTLLHFSEKCSVSFSSLKAML